MPLLTQAERIQLIDALEMVEYVHAEQGPTFEVLRALRPRYFAKGADWEGRLPPEELDACRDGGTEIVFLDTVVDSSTDVLRRFKRARRLDADHELAARVPLAEVLQRLDRLTQLVAPLDHRFHLPGLDQLLEYEEIVGGDGRDEEHNPLRGGARALRGRRSRGGAWAPPLWMRRGGAGGERVRYADAVLRGLREAGFSPDLTYHAFHVLQSHVLASRFRSRTSSSTRAAWRNGRRGSSRGSRAASTRTSPSTSASNLEPHEAHRGTFEFGLDLILDGLERRR